METQSLSSAETKRQSQGKKKESMQASIKKKALSINKLCEISLPLKKKVKNVQVARFLYAEKRCKKKFRIGSCERQRLSFCEISLPQLTSSTS